VAAGRNGPTRAEEGFEEKLAYVYDALKGVKKVPLIPLSHRHSFTKTYQMRG
jgi:hypothetical protein